MPADHSEASHGALVRYHRRLRPWRIAYVAALAAVIVASGVVVKLAYVHGEISHATLHTAASPVPTVALEPPSEHLTRAWSRDERTAIGVPYDAGIVVTYSTHAVVGRDARTGQVHWSYTRTDRTTCTAAQLDGVTIAVYRLHGDCDQLTGLDSGTGERLWTRTLDEDGHLVVGTPDFSVGSDTFMITTPTAIYALSPDGGAATGNGGLDRWVFAQPGCTIDSAVLGSSGALISQTCGHPDCSERKYCGAGTQLLLRDPFAGRDEDDKKNPDQIEWNLIGNSMRPVSADGVISATEPGSDTLTVLSADAGKQVATLPLAQPLASSAEAEATRTATAELIRVGTETYAVDNDDPRIRWHATTRALPTVTAVGEAAPPALADARLAVPTGDGIAELDPATGRVGHRFDVPAAADAGRVWPYGTGFLVTGPRTVLYR